MLPFLHTAPTDTSLGWYAHPDVVLLCLFLLGAYWYAISDLRERISDAGRVKRTQIALFGAGVISIYVASSSPMHELSENYLLSAHMLQHLVYTLVAPPLLIAGTPGWLFSAALRNARVYKIAKVALNPVFAFAVFNAVQLLTHLPATMDLALTTHWFHLLVHITLVVSALMMWWPILSPIPELPRLSYPLQMGYLFVQSLLPAVMAAFITFSTGVFYHYYGSAPRIWGISPVADQQLAGFVMKILGSLILWGFIAWAFFRWYDMEQKQSQDPQWDEVQEELTRMGIPLDPKR